MAIKNDSTRFSFFKSFVGFSLSSWVSAGLSLISTPIITRAFSTTELGKINMFISIVNMLMHFSYLGIDQAFTRFYNEPIGKNNKKSLLGVCFTVMCFIALAVSAGILFFRDILSSTVIGYVTYIIPVSVILSVISNIILRFFNLAARMEKNAFLFNVQAITITIISNISYVCTASFSPNAEYAIVFRTVLISIAAIVFWAFKAKKTVSFKCDLSKGVIKELFAYSLPICPAAILAVANSSVGQIVMKSYVDFSAVGIYSNAVTVASIITIVQSGINNYWTPFVFENYKTKQKQIIKMHHMISVTVIMCGLMILLFQDLIYLLLIGKNFWASKQLFPLLIISPICYTISETLGIGIRISKKPTLNIPVYIINFVVNIGLCFILLPRIGVIGAAVASAVSSIAMLIAKSFFGERSYRCSDNYFKLAFALASLVSVSVIHVFVYESMIKYAVYLVGIAIVCIVYAKEIKTIFLLIGDLKNKLLKKSTKDIQE